MWRSKGRNESKNISTLTRLHVAFIYDASSTFSTGWCITFLWNTNIHFTYESSCSLIYPEHRRGTFLMARRFAKRSSIHGSEVGHLFHIIFKWAAPAAATGGLIRIEEGEKEREIDRVLDSGRFAAIMRDRGRFISWLAGERESHERGTGNNYYPWPWCTAVAISRMPIVIMGARCIHLPFSFRLAYGNGRPPGIV